MSRPLRRRVPAGRAGRAAALLALGVALGVALGRAPLAAGPLEARALYRAAQALKDGPWREHVRALRRARGATRASDPLTVRVLASEASALRRAARVHGAAAAEAWAASLLPASAPERAAALLAQGRGLRAEGDDAAAQAPLLEAAERARREQPQRADDALDLLVEAASERGDEPRLAALAGRLEAERARPASVIEAFDQLGCLRLARGDRPGAQAALRAMERASRDAAARDPRDAARAAKAWLDARLRRRLAPP